MLAGLLAKFPTDHPAYAYAARLLAVLPAPALPAVELAEPLNPHELEILRLLVRGLSNADIARERVLAVSTVRWYLKHIYQKLSVHNRTQAADRARTLKLL
jgi:DNA-binding NarL/FixJ family response regulator